MAAEEQNLCAICLAEFLCGEDTIGMPCAHVFHDYCLATYANELNKPIQQLQCPICSTQVVDDELLAEAAETAVACKVVEQNLEEQNPQEPRGADPDHTEDSAEHSTEKDHETVPDHSGGALPVEDSLLIPCEEDAEKKGREEEEKGAAITLHAAAAPKKKNRKVRPPSSDPHHPAQAAETMPADETMPSKAMPQAKARLF